MKQEVHIPAFHTYRCVLCGTCCRGLEVTASEEEFRRLSGHPWPRYFPELEGVELFEPAHGAPGRYRLPHRRSDAECVFLRENKCLMHMKLGLDKKLYACRCYPYTFAFTPTGVYAGLRFGCPGIGSEGAPRLASDRAGIERLAREFPDISGAPRYLATMPLRKGVERSWDELLGLESLLMGLFVRTDLPLKRRLLAGALTVEHLARAKVDELSGEELAGVLDVMLEACIQNSDKYAPSGTQARAGAALARQLLGDLLIQAEPVYYALSVMGRLRFRFRALFERAAFAAGRGRITADGIGQVAHARAESSRLEPDAESEAIVASYLAGKLFGKNFFGPLFCDYPFLEGLALLLAVSSAAVTVARACALERGESAALGRGDVRKAIQAVDSRYGSLKAFRLRPARTRAALLTREGVLSGLMHSMFEW